MYVFHFPFPIFLLFPNPHHTDDALDLEVLSAAITALGGQWRTRLTCDITHLFAVGPSSDKYETAMHFQDDTQTFLPHCFGDSVELGAGVLTAWCEWPDPKYLRREIGKEEDGLGAGGENGGARKSQLTGKKKRLFRGVGEWIHLLLIVIIIEIEYQRLMGRLTADIQARIMLLSDSTTDQPHTPIVYRLPPRRDYFPPPNATTSRIFVSLACRPYPTSSQDNQQHEYTLALLI